jgi:hypothetical protein
MVLALDNKSKRIIATVQEGGRIKEYECIITGCEKSTETIRVHVEVEKSTRNVPAFSVRVNPRVMWF